MEKECKGIILRANVSNYYKEYDYPFKSLIQKITYNVNLTVSRKKSCKGCEKCGIIWDNLQNINNDWPINIGNINHGEFYQLVKEVESTDPYTGEPDDWFFTLKEIKK